MPRSSMCRVVTSSSREAWPRPRASGWVKTVPIPPMGTSQPPTRTGRGKTCTQPLRRPPERPTTKFRSSKVASSSM